MLRLVSAEIAAWMCGNEGEVVSWCVSRHGGGTLGIRLPRSGVASGKANQNFALIVLN